ncbi:MAG TPA: alanine--tRNA ligase [Chthoniobacterales bacterium]|jgi:alanyl-tRNA synthetase|nr:alanine--tRNA ligase [Chthoniobacterales bacterium]
MNASEIRQSFLDFFREKRHTIVPSASLLPSSPNLLFTNAGMNQFVPYFLGQEKPPFSPPRAADTQKCIRAGGKHNDLDDVGFDTYHHTFFEMLGNWSFGDYFKKEAIRWAWELLVERWKFPPDRLYATVYEPTKGDPADFDEEAHANWAALFKLADLDPRIHIVDGSRKDNFWMMGDTGPCGPCSEIHMDLTKDGNTRGALVNQGSPLCIEIWNLVFIQFSANADGSFSTLPARHVDTGMGFERVAGIVASTEEFRRFDHPISNYNSDVFQPIIEQIAALSGKAYGKTLPRSRVKLSEQEKADVAFRVIADHLRTLCFAIADGIIPSNTDRNYVLRRVLRRAVMFGRYLGFGSEGFLSRLAPTVTQNFGSVFPELEVNKARLVSVLDSEESLFNHTLDRGLRIFEEEFRNRTSNEFPAEAAFRLYDTYGFPVDLTEVLVRERGLKLDLQAVEMRLEQQRERSRAAQEKEIVATVEESVATEFVGFYHDEAKARVIQVVKKDKNELAVVDRSPLYAEMGGQVSDTGEIVFADGSSVPVVFVAKQGRTFYLKVAGTVRYSLPADVILKVDQPRRRKIEANHTATHLLHWALHEIVGTDVSQKGSYVGPDRLRFDFNSNAVSWEQLRKIEQLVNSRIIANETVSWVEVPYKEVKSRADIMQFFGEKYGANVRVVQIGGNAGCLDGYSMELCGGTHVFRTGQLGLFHIASEGAISAGVRRIEALTGLVALEYLQEKLDLKSAKIDELNGQLLELKKAVEKDRAHSLQREAERIAAEFPIDQGSIVEVIHDADAEQLQAVANNLRAKGFAGVAVLFGREANQVHVLVMVDSSLTGEVQAGKVVQELTGILGGRGGGKADLARGSGKDLSQLEPARRRAIELTAGV